MFLRVSRAAVAGVLRGGQVMAEGRKARLVKMVREWQKAAETFWREWYKHRAEFTKAYRVRKAVK